MLHQKHRVPGVAEPQHRALHELDVAVVQAHAGFVQNVQHIRKRRVDVLRNLAALRLAATKCPNTPVQTQISQADFFQRRQTRADSRLQVGREGIDQPIDPNPKPRYRHRAHIGNGSTLDETAPGLLVQASTAAVRADAHPEHRVQDGAVQQALLRIDDAAVHSRNKPLVLRCFGPVGRRVFQADLRAVQEEVQLLRRVVANLLVKVEKPAVGVAYPSPSALAECDVMNCVFVV